MTGLENSFVSSQTHSLIGAGHVISLSIYPTCPNRKFSFSSLDQGSQPGVPQTVDGPFQFHQGLLKAACKLALDTWSYFIKGLPHALRLQLHLALIKAQVVEVEHAITANATDVIEIYVGKNVLYSH